MAKCELCGTEVRALLFGNPNEVVLCPECIRKSRTVDGTLNDAFKKVRAKRNPPVSEQTEDNPEYDPDILEIS